MDEQALAEAREYDGPAPVEVMTDPDLVLARRRCGLPTR